jgi:hypothetical protein
MDIINNTNSRLQALELEFIESRRENTLIQALALAPAPAPVIIPIIIPIVTPVFEPSTSFKSIPFRADKVGYFDPDLDTDAKGDIVTIGKDLWFRDVFLFTDRLKDIVVIKEAVRSN